MNKRFDPEAELTPGEDERMQELLAELGLAMVNAQAVEFGLVSLLATAAERDGSEIRGEDVRQLMDTRFSQTMGQLIRDAAATVDLPPDATTFLEISLRARNWLTHHFYRQFGMAAFDERLRLQGLALVRHARETFEATQEALQEAMLRILAEAGITPEQVSEGAQAAMERYVDSGLDPDDLWNESLKRRFQ